MPSPPRPDRCVPNGHESTVATTDGARLAVTDAGPADGQAVVLAHCWTGAREVWAPVAHRLLATGHRVVLYDQRGHGSSTGGASGCTVEALGDDLHAVLGALALGRVVLAGHSMGGMAIQSYLRRHGADASDRVRGVALVATTAGGLGRGRRLDALAVRAVASPTVERLARRRRGTRLVRGAFGRGAEPPDVAVTRDLFVACPPATRAGFLRAMLAMDLRGALAGVTAPLTVVVGGVDALTPPAHARALAASHPAAALHVLPRRGHMLPLEAPDEVAAAVRLLTDASPRPRFVDA